MNLHHDVVGAIFLEIWGIANIAIAMKRDRVTPGCVISFLVGSVLVAVSHLV